MRVLLISMPFVSVRYPSPALSLLKAVLESEGVPCDVRYLNVFFQAMTRRPSIYERIADLILVGEWIFGEALFGREWAASERAVFDALDGPMLPPGFKENGAREAFSAIRASVEPFLRKCLEEIPWENYGIIGFTSVFSQHVASLALAKQIKDRWKDKIIAFGGANCEAEMGTALLRLFPFVDWVFSGEADLSFPTAVRGWFEGRPPEGVPGVSYRSGGIIVDQGTGPSPQLDDLPYPDFEDYFSALRHWAPELVSFVPISLELSRGCWWGNRSQCVFCGLNCKNMRFRRKSAGRAEAEIKTLTSRYGVDKVILTDSILDMSFFKTLLPALADWGGLDELFLEVKANLNCEQIRLLKSAGVSMLQPGIESLDTEMLSHMRKGTTLLQNIRFLKCARQYGIRPTWNLLCGFPGENSEAYARMTSLVPSIVHLSPPMDVSRVLVVRFSPLFEDSGKWGMTHLTAHKGYRAIYPFDPDELNQLACFFDFDHDAKSDVPKYIEPLKQQVRLWKQYWEQQTPPSLTAVEEPGDKVVLYDTRPSRLQYRTELQGALATAYAVCREIRSFDEIAGFVRDRRGANGLKEESLLSGLNDLVTRRLMLKEKDDYLSLGTAPICSADASEEW